MTPLIEIKVMLNDSLELNGVYDSGSNVSLINSRLLKKTKINEINNTDNRVLKTISGDRKRNGTLITNL